jgi:hypothetical protein
MDSRGQTEEASTVDTGFNLHSITLPLATASPGAKIKVEVASSDGVHVLKKDSFTIQVRSWNNPR